MAALDLPCHTGLVLLSDRGSALGRVTADKRVRLVRGDREAFGISYGKDLGFKMDIVLRISVEANKVN